MIHDIHELDDDGIRMRACWKKAHNFVVTFAEDYFKVIEKLKSGRYGDDWNHHKWLLLKVGTTEAAVLLTLKAFERALADEHRQKAENNRNAQSRQRRQARAEIEQRRREEQARKAAEKAAKEAEREAAAKKAAEEKAAKEAEKKREARNTRRRLAAEKKRKEQEAEKKQPRRKPEPKPEIKLQPDPSIKGLVEIFVSAPFKTQEIRTQWINAALELAVKFREARAEHDSNNYFGEWVDVNNLRRINAHDRAALIEMGENVEYARRIFESSESWSCQLIWKNRFANASKTNGKTEITEEYQGLNS